METGQPLRTRYANQSSGGLPEASFHLEFGVESEQIDVYLEERSKPRAQIRGRLSFCPSALLPAGGIRSACAAFQPKRRFCCELQSTGPVSPVIKSLLFNCICVSNTAGTACTYICVCVCVISVPVTLTRSTAHFVTVRHLFRFCSRYLFKKNQPCNR